MLSFATTDETRVTVTSSAVGNMRFAVNQASTSATTSTIRSPCGVHSANDPQARRPTRSMTIRSRPLSHAPSRSPSWRPNPGSDAELGPTNLCQSAAWSDATASLDAGGRAAVVNAITSIAKENNLVSTGFLEATAGAVAIANNKGLFAYRRQTAAALTTTIRTPDGAGSGWAGASTNDFSKINPADMGRRAADKARRSVNAVAIEPGRYTVVLEPTRRWQSRAAHRRRPRGVLT